MFEPKIIEAIKALEIHQIRAIYEAKMTLKLELDNEIDELKRIIDKKMSGE